MLIIDDDYEFDTTLESTNLDEYELIDLPMEQPDGSPHECMSGSPHECMSVGMAPTLDTGITSGLALREGSSTILHSGVDPCQGSFLYSPH